MRDPVKEGFVRFYSTSGVLAARITFWGNTGVYVLAQVPVYTAALGLKFLQRECFGGLLGFCLGSWGFGFWGLEFGLQPYMVIHP